MLDFQIAMKKKHVVMELLAFWQEIAKLAANVKLVSAEEHKLIMENGRSLQMQGKVYSWIDSNIEELYRIHKES